MTTDTLTTIVSTGGASWDATTPLGYAALLVLLASATLFHLSFGGAE